jgi:predicted dinucleotide-binding enzyme
MKIGIVGSGYIGATAARLFIKACHEVALSNSRGPETLRDLVAELGERARAVTVEEAAEFGEMVLVAVPFGKYRTLPASAFYNKIVIDANNYYPQRDGHFAELDNGETTSSELMSAHLKGARLVKAFNTIYYVHLGEQGNTNLPLEDRRVIFIAGDDSGAKETVARLIEEIGFAAVDTGFLHEGGKRQQPDAPIYNKTLNVKEANELLSAA